MGRRSDAAHREIFGRFHVYEQLGVGGMAVVHRAKWLGVDGFESNVALKRLRPALRHEPEAVAAFIHEAKLSARLQHGNIAQTFDLGKVGTTYFIAEELVDGRSLRTILQRSAAAGMRAPIGAVLSILGEVCDALDYTHCRVDELTGAPLGIVHRDISHSNLMLTRTGHVKLIDFGVAEAAGYDTYSKRVRGKYGYMSPEALRGQALDGRSDLYSVGVVAHELLVGKRLFPNGRETRDLPVPPSTLRGRAARALDELVLKALAPEREARWSSAEALRSALHSVTRRQAFPASSTQVVDWIDRLFSAEEDESTSIEDSMLIAEMTTQVETPAFEIVC